MKFGIIGYGGMGSFHAAHIKMVEGFSVKGAYDINPDKHAKVKADGFEVYLTQEEILADKDIDIIVIATPNNFHKDQSIAALRAGKHVICEKPVMMNLEELDEVIAVSNETGCLFAAHQNRRWDADFRVVKQVKESGTIGKLYYIESRVQGANGIPGDWRCEPVAGGGMVYDWGVHLIDQMLLLTDAPLKEVYAHVLKVKYNVDDNFKLLLTFEDGLRALIEVSTYNFIPLPRWHVSGDAGTMVLDDFNGNGKIVKANLEKMDYTPGIVYTASGPTKTMAPRPIETIETMDAPKPAPFPDFKDYYREFAAAIKSGGEAPVTHTQMRNVMKVIEFALGIGK
ncbi:MAG: Gfo/Idh/MocA family oxidoreductase [Defluviitaleaceae bacterium]|nr:Gfo/Idh/MocA family oxidoreductase [Defluviitaleaceae bacterium]